VATGDVFVTQQPPNILFLWTDEQRPDTIGAYGNRRIRTPNLDRLAEEAIVFEQAYCTAPLCTPSRGSVLTGTYPHTHGAIRNNVPLPVRVPTIAELLRPHGYACGYAGKWHLGDELQPQRGFDWWSSIEDEYTHDHRAEGFSNYHRWLVGRGVEPLDTGRDGSKVFSRASAAKLPEELGKPAFLAQEACRFLDEHGREPFALYVNFLEPHFPFFGPWDDLYSPEQMTLPETWYSEPDESMPLRYRLRRDGFAHHNSHVDTNDEAGWKAVLARYWALSSLVDKYTGQILAHLDQLGLAGSTIVVFSSDHGDMMGEHRLLAKAVPYEGAARVPLIVRVPGLAACRIAAPVSQVDLVPTLLDLVDQDTPPHVQGQSLLPLMRSGESTESGSDSEVVCEWSGVPRGGSVSGYRPPVDDGSDSSEAVFRAMASQSRTIRRGRWKLTVDEAGEHELYDLEVDPHEARNLLSPAARTNVTPEVRQAGVQLWQRLLAWQQRTGDDVHLPDPFDSAS
jgi:arylsulfatase A-like enzyme